MFYPREVFFATARSRKSLPEKEVLRAGGELRPIQYFPLAAALIVAQPPAMARPLFAETALLWFSLWDTNGNGTLALTEIGRQRGSLQSRFTPPALPRASS